MKLKDRKQTIPWTGLGLILGGALGSLIGQNFSIQIFAVFCGGGAAIGLILGAMVDSWARKDEEDGR